MPRVVTVVSRKGCHLCDDVIRALESLALRYDLEVKTVDIDRDKELHDKYWLTVPVVQIKGKDVFDARRISAGLDYTTALERLLAS